MKSSNPKPKLSQIDFFNRWHGPLLRKVVLILMQDTTLFIATKISGITQFHDKYLWNNIYDEFTKEFDIGLSDPELIKYIKITKKFIYNDTTAFLGNIPIHFNINTYPSMTSSISKSRDINSDDIKFIIKELMPEILFKF